MFKLKSPALLAASQLVLNFMKEKEIFESPVGWGCVTLVSLETRQLQSMRWMIFHGLTFLDTFQKIPG